MYSFPSKDYERVKKISDQKPPQGGSANSKEESENPKNPKLVYSSSIVSGKITHTGKHALMESSTNCTINPSMIQITPILQKQSKEDLKRKKPKEEENIYEDPALVEPNKNSKTNKKGIKRTVENEGAISAAEVETPIETKMDECDSDAYIEENNENEEPSGTNTTKRTKAGNNNYQRPPYSYASLIAQAINSTSNSLMKLNEIYNWIMETYPYYKYQGSGWQVSV
jgi:hypothetical protein